MMEVSSVYVSRIPAPRAVASARPAARRYGRSLGDWLSWGALIVLPVTSLLAAVSLLGQATR
jgi:hypothetical protein